MALISVINGDMLGATSEPGEHVDWSTPDTMTAAEWEDVLDQPIEEFAAQSPHMIVWEA